MNVDTVRKGLFINPENEESLFEFGYIKIPFFSNEEMEELKDFYHGVHSSDVNLEGTMNGIHMTTWSGNSGYKRMVASFIRNLFDKGISRVFQSHRHLNHVFIAKEGGNETEFNTHQDWSVVDEQKEYSVNIWVPLHDVDKENGALWILPGSHKLNQPIRGAGCLFPDYLKEMESLKDEVKCIDVKEGEALIFFHSTIHGSPPNNTTRKRVVACCTVIHKEADVTTYFQRDEVSPLEVYRTNDDFMFNYSDIMNDAAKKPPLGQLVETRPTFVLNKITRQDMLDAIPIKLSKKNA